MDDNPDLQQLNKLIANSLKIKLVDCGNTHVQSYSPDYRPIWSASVVSFLASGKSSSYLGNSTRPIHRIAPSVGVLPQKMPYRTHIDSPEGVTFIWSHIYFTIMESVDLISLLELPIKVTDKPAAKQIGQYNLELIELFHNTPMSPVVYTRIQSICYDILSIILAHNKFRSDIGKLFKKHQRLAPLVREISTHYKEQWTIDKMMKIACLSRSRLHHIFKVTYGKSPLEYATTVRLYKAQKLLLTTDLPIGEIAAETGYDDPLYFSRCFSNYFGLSPSRYRQTEQLYQH